jgi:hypothetical protein
MERNMTIIRCTECAYHNDRMRAAGYEIIAIETYAWPDGETETEILWGKDGPIDERELTH